MTPRETPIRSSFLGFVKKADCPGCGTVLSKGLGSAEVVCSSCGDYAVFGAATLTPLSADASAGAPAYAAPTPWPDMQAPTFGALRHPVAALADMLMTKSEGVRALEAKWPDGCCVCGAPATREETLSATVAFAAPDGMTRRQKEATVVARGVPHCAAHKDGARFDVVLSFGDMDMSVLGLFFRSYAYQTRFRKANPWRWRA